MDGRNGGSLADRIPADYVERELGRDGAAAAFIAERDLVGSLRFDEFALCIVSDGRAMVRHHVDAMN